MYHHKLPTDQLLWEIQQAVHLDKNDRAFGYIPVQAALGRQGV